MIKHLQDLWILEEYGLILFSKIIHHNTDDQCLGGLTSALYSFAQTGLQETLLRFTTNKFEYKILEKRDLLFVATFSTKTKEKVALYELNHIAEKFCKLYPIQMIENWNHDMHKFDKFEQEVKTRNELLGEKIDQLWDHGQTLCSCHV